MHADPTLMVLWWLLAVLPGLLALPRKGQPGPPTLPREHSDTPPAGDRTLDQLIIRGSKMDNTLPLRGHRLEPHLTNRLPERLPHGMIPSHPIGMVPSPSDHLPVQDLIEVPNKQFDPRTQDLNPRRLKKLLGAHFDSNYMSIQEPKELVKSMFETVRQDLKLRPKLSRDLRQLDKTVLAGGYQLRMRMRKKQQQKVKRFLQAYSHCPVQHRWKDLGERFWPRWINESRCYHGRSCSIPKGMSCQPHESTNLTLLRWFCPSWDKRRRCTWIQIQYPMVTSCKCAC